MLITVILTLDTPPLLKLMIFRELSDINPLILYYMYEQFKNSMIFFRVYLHNHLITLY